MAEREQQNQTDQSDRTDPSDSRFRRLRPSGGYRALRSFQVATVIYDATVAFCERFIDKRSRTVDQMVQAARSGRQNIAEGSRAAATSSQTELRLVNVARASLDERLLDYEDFLRQHGLRQWAKDDPEALAVREVGRQRQSDQTSSVITSPSVKPDSPLRLPKRVPARRRTPHADAGRRNSRCGGRRAARRAARVRAALDARPATRPRSTVS
jgi:four helix bundle protein